MKSSIARLTRQGLRVAPSRVIGVTGTRLRATAAAMAILTAGGVHAAPVELVTNGGFESGDTGFTSDFGTNAGFGAARYSVAGLGVFSNLAPFSGQFSMYVNGSDLQPPPTVWAQQVNVEANMTYDFSFAFGTWINVAPFGQVSVRAGGVEFAQFTAPGSHTWETKSAQFTATTTGLIELALVELSVGQGGNDYAFDNISLKARTVTPPNPDPDPNVIPLPAAGWLLLAGLGGLAVLRRRR